MNNEYSKEITREGYNDLQKELETLKGEIKRLKFIITTSKTMLLLIHCNTYCF